MVSLECDSETEDFVGTSVLNAINIWPWSHIGCEGGWGREASIPIRSPMSRRRLHGNGGPSGEDKI